jgi:GMP synthase (glutamine-hydrolysing)
MREARPLAGRASGAKSRCAPLPDWRDYEPLVVTGGGMSVWEVEASPWLVGEKRSIRDALLAGMTYLGVFLGSQLLASVLGTRM